MFFNEIKCNSLFVSAVLRWQDEPDLGWSVQTKQPEIHDYQGRVERVDDRQIHEHG